MAQQSALLILRFVARFVNGVHVVVDRVNKTHSYPFGRVGDAERFAAKKNAALGQRQRH